MRITGHSQTLEKLLNEFNQEWLEGTQGQSHGMLLNPWLHDLANSVVLDTDFKGHFIGTHCIEHYMALEEDIREGKRWCTLEGGHWTNKNAVWRDETNKSMEDKNSPSSFCVIFPFSLHHTIQYCIKFHTDDTMTLWSLKYISHCTRINIFFKNNSSIDKS